MNIVEPLFLKPFAIIFIFMVLLGTAAFEKWRTFQTPDWFIQQFEGTLISRFPGGAKASYWIIATLEGMLLAFFAASFFYIGLLPLTLVASMFFFGILCFGLRIAGDYQGSANMFIYFSASLLSLMAVQ